MNVAALVAAAATAPLVAHAGYFLLLPAIARRFGRPWKTGPFEGSLALLVPARDEEATIRGKLENILADGSLPHGTDLVVVADGCTDGTAAAAQQVTGVRVVAFAEGRGKATRFNEIVPSLRADVVAFTDATARWEPGTIGRLLEPFADPGVGGVGGALAYELPASGAGGVAAGTREYFDLEARIRRAESLLVSATGFSGSLYAVRRELFRPLSPGANEDFQAALDVAAAGKRAVIADAVVRDESHRDWGAELRMRRRVVGRAFRAMARSASLAATRPTLALMLFLHKVVRFLAWALVAVAVAAAVPAAGGGAAKGLLVALLLLGAGAFEVLLALRFGPGLEGIGAGNRLLRRMSHLLLAQLAAALALFDLVLGRVPAGWKPERSEGRA